MCLWPRAASKDYSANKKVFGKAGSFGISCWHAGDDGAPKRLMIAWKWNGNTMHCVSPMKKQNLALAFFAEFISQKSMKSVLSLYTLWDFIFLLLRFNWASTEMSRPCVSPARSSYVRCQGHKRQLEFLSQEKYSQTCYIGKNNITSPCLLLKNMAAGKYSNVYFLEMFLFSFPMLKRK